MKLISIENEYLNLDHLVYAKITDEEGGKYSDVLLLFDVPKASSLLGTGEIEPFEYRAKFKKDRADKLRAILDDLL